MAKCDCTPKFVGLETGEPDEQQAEINDGVVSIEIRLTRNCSECGSERKETTFSMEEDVSEEIEAHNKQHHPDVAADALPGLTLEVDYEVTESGGGRYAKNLIGVTAEYTVTCDACGTETSAVTDGSMHDETQASGFDDL